MGRLFCLWPLPAFFHAKAQRGAKQVIGFFSILRFSWRLCEQYISRQGAKGAQRIHKKIPLLLCKLCDFASNIFHTKAQRAV